jgi:hypothetical protein
LLRPKGETRSGAGSALRSTLPLADKGNVSSTMTVLGTMAEGRWALACRKSARTKSAWRLRRRGA